MSTPRTDAELIMAGYAPYCVVPTSFARELEREVESLSAQVADARKEAADSEQLRYEENRRACEWMDKAFAAEAQVAELRPAAFDASLTDPMMNKIASTAAWLRGQEWVGEKPTRGEAADALEQLCADFQKLGAQVAELKKDAERYRFLKPLYHSIDFEYGDSSEGPTPSIVFAIPPETKWSGDLDASVDAAKDAERRTVLNRTDGSVRCGLEPCCGRPDCENYLNARDAAKESGVSP